MSRPAARRVPRRRGLLAGATGFAVAAGVAAAFVGSSLTGGDSVLSPQEAVAAVSADLHDNQILHWSVTQVQTNGRPLQRSFEMPRVTHAQIDQWVDLKTDATHVTIKAPDLTTKDENWNHFEQWVDPSGNSWQLSLKPHAKPGSRITVNKMVSRTKTPNTGLSPVLGLRKSLDDAAHGRATLSAGGTFHGVPVTKVTQHFGRPNEIRTTTTTWIVRTHQPSLLKQVSDEVDPHGHFQAHVVTTTNVWSMHPSHDAAAQRSVEPPSFDPAKYRVVEPMALPRNTP